jgi:hypothetical protein
MLIGFTTKFRADFKLKFIKVHCFFKLLVDMHAWDARAST